MFIIVYVDHLAILKYDNLYICTVKSHFITYLATILYICFFLFWWPILNKLPFISMKQNLEII